MIISRWVLLRMRIPLDKNCTENQNTHCTFNNFFFFRKSNRLWDNVKNTMRPYRQQMTIWRMRIACCITKATNTHTHRICNISFPMQQRFHERPSTYTACLLGEYRDYYDRFLYDPHHFMLHHHLSFNVGEEQHLPGSSESTNLNGNS